MEINIRLSDMGFSEKYVVLNGVDFRIENAEYYEMFTKAHDDKEEISVDVRYIVPFNVNDSRLDDMRDKTYGPTRDLIRAIISGNKEIEDAIEEYRIRLNGLKISDTIDAMNADLN